MTNFAQGATNSIVQFVNIVLKILAPLLHDRAKPFVNDVAFVNDVGVKKPKTTYNNKELAPEIKQYVVEDIQNLDKVLADLEQAEVTIAGAKPQFCRADIKIVGYICDADGRYPDISKILKMLDRPKCTDTTSACSFIRVCVYYRIWNKNFAQVAFSIYHLFKKNTLCIWRKE